MSAASIGEIGLTTKGDVLAKDEVLAKGDVMGRRVAVILAGYRWLKTGGVSPEDQGLIRGGLADPDGQVRAAALSALAQCQTLLASDIADKLTDEDLRVRRRACELASMFAHGPAELTSKSIDQEQLRVDEALLEHLKTGDDTMAELAAWALGERHQQASSTGEREPSDPTDNAWQISAPLEREAMSLAENKLETLQITEIVSVLVDTVRNHGDALVREAAVAALGCIGHDDGKVAILHAIGDKATVRRRAVIALAAFEGEDVEAALVGATGDRDWQVRQAAEDLLA